MDNSKNIIINDNELIIMTQIVSPLHVVLKIVRSMVRAFEMGDISIFYEPSISKSNNNFILNLLLLLILKAFCPFSTTRLQQ